MTRTKPARVAAFAVVCCIVAAAAPARAEYKPPRLPDNEHFTIDPIVDGLLIAGGATFDILLGEIVQTGELKPTKPSADAKDHLLAIDKIAVTQTPDPHAGTYSNIGIFVAYSYALIDPIMSGLRDGRRAMLVDAVLYAESIAITGAFTQATKIGVRRPRPIDYAACAGIDQVGSQCDNTDLQLSFFSGHASTTATISATATYLAFSRSGWRRPRPWITLGAGVALTSFVSYWRVRSGAHFPTDVIMGSMAGAGIGILVPHFHRLPHYHQDELEAPPVIIGYAPVPGGGTMTAEWRF
jgi:undecaprenyl-diphosphatase